MSCFDNARNGQPFPDVDPEDVARLQATLERAFAAKDDAAEVLCILERGAASTSPREPRMRRGAVTVLFAEDLSAPAVLLDIAEVAAEVRPSRVVVFARPTADAGIEDVRTVLGPRLRAMFSGTEQVDVFIQSGPHAPHGTRS